MGAVRFGREKKKKMKKKREVLTLASLKKPSLRRYVLMTMPVLPRPGNHQLMILSFRSPAANGGLVLSGCVGTSQAMNDGHVLLVFTQPLLHGLHDLEEEGQRTRAVVGEAKVEHLHIKEMILESTAHQSWSEKEIALTLLSNLA